MKLHSSCRKGASLTLTATLVLMVGCGEVRYRDSVIAEERVEKISVKGDVGIIDLVPGDAARVEYAVRAPDGAASVQPSEKGGVLSVLARCHTPVLCAVDAQVHVPEGVTVEIELGIGEVWSTGVGDLNVSLGQGDVDVDTSGDVTVQVGQGNARVHTIGSESVRIAVGDGDIVVSAAPDQWNLNLTARSEAVHGIVHDATAIGQMELIAPSGAVTVRSSSAGRDSGTP